MNQWYVQNNLFAKFKKKLFLELSKKMTKISKCDTLTKQVIIYIYTCVCVFLIINVSLQVWRPHGFRRRWRWSKHYQKYIVSGSTDLVKSRVTNLAEHTHRHTHTSTNIPTPPGFNCSGNGMFLKTLVSCCPFLQAKVFLFVNSHPDTKASDDLIP